MQTVTFVFLKALKVALISAILFKIQYFFYLLTQPVGKELVSFRGFHVAFLTTI